MLDINCKCVVIETSLCLAQANVYSIFMFSTVNTFVFRKEKKNNL